MHQETWRQISTTFKGRKIEGEYCHEGDIVKVKHDNREKGEAVGKAGVEVMARDLLRELAEDGEA